MKKLLDSFTALLLRFYGLRSSYSNNNAHALMDCQGGRLNFDAQIDYFANTRQDIISSIGVPAALNLFNRSLFSVSIGSNDFINNYLTPTLPFSERKTVSPEFFVAEMISKFRVQLTVMFLKIMIL